jgi:hypothetical protein
MKNNKYQFVPMVGKGRVACDVDKYWIKEATKEAKSIKKWLNDNNGSFPEPYITAYAVSHCQVTNDPYPFAFFVVAKDFMNSKESPEKFSWPDQIIYNPEILETPATVEKDIPKRVVSKDKDGDVTHKIVKSRGMVSNQYEVEEACMSFNHKKAKKVSRYYRIKVKYQTRGFFGRIRTHTEWIEGLKAHIFQHEMDHMNGDNIYFNHKHK